MTPAAGPNPRISAVIPAFRRPELLRALILSLFAQDLEQDQYEIIVVDSTPDDSVVSMLKELEASHPGRLRWFTKKPEGPGASRNLGALNARGEFLAFMDGDCQGSPGWLRAGLAAFSEGVGIVQGQTLPPPGKSIGVFTHSMIVDRESFLYEGCNVFYRKEAYMQAGGFPVDINPRAMQPMGGEDVVLAWKTKRLGWRTRFAPEALVYHDVLPITPRQWIIIKQMFIFPKLIREFPELRQFMFWRYFYSRASACFTGVVLGLLLAFVHPLWLLLCLPYIVLRASEPTQTLKGPLRLLRPLFYSLRDGSSFGFLVAGSVRYRRLLL